MRVWFICHIFYFMVCCHISIIGAARGRGTTKRLSRVSRREFRNFKATSFIACKKLEERKCRQNCISRSSKPFGYFGRTHACQKRQNGSHGSAVENFAILRPLWFMICKNCFLLKCHQNGLSAQSSKWTRAKS